MREHRRVRVWWAPWRYGCRECGAGWWPCPEAAPRAPEPGALRPSSAVAPRPEWAGDTVPLPAVAPAQEAPVLVSTAPLLSRAASRGWRA